MQIKLSSLREFRGFRAIPLFAKKPSHPFVPLIYQAAGARSAGPGRSIERRLGASPWTGTSAMAGFSFFRRKACVAMAILSLAMIFDGVPGTDAMTRIRRTDGASSTHNLASFVAEAAERFGIPTAWIRAVIGIESAGNQHAISPKGAMGLMQIMPKTYAELRATYGFGRNPYDPHDNILAGAAYLREMHDLYGSPGFLAAYNAGPVRYENHLATGRPLPEETRVYVSTLASRLGLKQADGIRSVKVTATDRTPLNRGPLFFVQDIIDQLTAKMAHKIDAKPSSEMQTIRTSNARSVVDVTALVPQQHGLFVHRSSVEIRP